MLHILDWFHIDRKFKNHAESTLNTLINQRQKGKQKMQWTRDGAHNILQIRASIHSNSWKNDWIKVENILYKLAA